MCVMVIIVWQLASKRIEACEVNERPQKTGGFNGTNQQLHNTL